MGIPQATVAQLQIEGITTISDPVDFEKETLQQMADNLRKPRGRVPDPNPAAAAGATIPTPPFCLWRKVATPSYGGMRIGPLLQYHWT